MKSKKLKITTAGVAIISAILFSWAAYEGEGYIWLIGPIILAAIIIIGLYLTRDKEWRYDERNATIDEKSGFWACIVFLFLAFISSLTLIILGREQPDLSPIGWTLAISGFAITVFSFLVRLYLSRKMGGKE